MRIFLFLTIVILSIFEAQSQQGESLSQYEFLSSFELEYNAPVEVQATSMSDGSLGPFNYEVGVSVDNGQVLALVNVIPDHGNLLPHVEIAAKVSHLATNEEEYDIRMISPSSEDRLLLNADLAAHAIFKPKKSTGRYSRGKLTSLYREGVGLVYIYYLYHDELPYDELFRFMDLE